MVARILLLIAFVIVSFKFFTVIHIEVFKKELCNDDFYNGGIQKNTKRTPSIQKKVSKRRKPQTTRPIYVPSASYKSDSKTSNYNSYSAYKKSVSSK